MNRSILQLVNFNIKK